MTQASAKVICDSISPAGDRLTTVEATVWRPLLAEVNTHRIIAKNSASSRAIPVTKTLDRYMSDPALPLVWPKEQKGMQGGDDLTGQDLEDAQDLWYRLYTYVGKEIRDYVDQHPDPSTRLHKSLLNRWLEIGMWQTQILTATSWDGFFWQRCHADAEPHFRAMAKAIEVALEESTPTLVRESEWHLPYWAENGGHESDWDDAESALREGLGSSVIEIAKRCSVARCARVSYLTHSGVRDLSEDLRLYGDLADNRIAAGDVPHASPGDHVATPWEDNSVIVTLPNGRTMGPVPKLGNLNGWAQHRHLELGF